MQKAGLHIREISAANALFNKGYPFDLPPTRGFLSDLAREKGALSPRVVGEVLEKLAVLLEQD